MRSLYATFLAANVVVLPLYGYLAARLAAVTLRVPFNVLLTAIAAGCVMGAYALNNNPADIWIMAALAVLAFGLRRGGFPMAQVVSGMVPGPILEQHFMVSAIKSSWNLTSFFDRPIALALMAATLPTIFAGLRFKPAFAQEKRAPEGTNAAGSKIA